MLDLIQKFINKSDKDIISEITNEEFDLLISKVDNWELFNNNKKHIETELDKIGMHLLRCILAERILEYKRNLLGVFNSKEYHQFLENGFVILNKYEQNDFNKLMTHITTVPNYYSLKNNAIRLDMSLNYDLQYTLHVDTFHSSFKVFGYLHDVNVENGPFCYVSGSHKNTKQKLKFLYDASVKRSDLILNHNLTREENEITWNDSFRLPCDTDYCVDSITINKYLHDYNLPNETLVTGENGIFIIADTSGLHRRYPIKTSRETSRLVLDRPNPFKM